MRTVIERVVFFICGIFTILIARVYWGFSRFAPTPEMNWLSFAVALLPVGFAAVVVSLLPRRSLNRGSVKDGPRRISFRLKFLLSFIVVGTLPVIAESFIPLGAFRPSMPLVYSLCPACVLTVTVDPSMTGVIFFLAPLSGLVFGAFGGVLGTVLSFIRGR
jgi:hypothetical protein